MSDITTTFTPSEKKTMKRLLKWGRKFSVFSTEKKLFNESVKLILDKRRSKELS